MDSLNDIWNNNENKNKNENKNENKRVKPQVIHDKDDNKIKT